MSGGEVSTTCTNGQFDGFRVDSHGRLWGYAANGVHCLNTDGSLIGKVHSPELVDDVRSGGAKLNRVLIAGTTSLYSVYLNGNGLSPV